MDSIGTASDNFQAVERGAQGEPAALGIGADHELDHETALAVRIVDGKVCEGCLPSLVGHGLVLAAERAVPEILAHVSS
jgi:hypothetical protein